MDTVRAAADTPRPRDRGLQGERTALAWNRTGLALLTNGLLVLRTGWVNEQAALSIAGTALLAAAAAAIVYGAWRRRRLLSERGRIAPPAVAIATMAVVTLVACAAGIASVLQAR